MSAPDFFLHLIKISNDDANDTDDEDEAVAAHGVVVGAEALGEEVEARVDLEHILEIQI
jgi:hypothetical protein